MPSSGLSNVEELHRTRAKQRARSGARRFDRRRLRRSTARLRDAVEALRELPAHAYARDRLRLALAAGERDSAEIASIVGADAALTLAVLTATQRAGMSKPVRGNVERAVEALPDRELEAIASDIAGYDVFGRSSAGIEADRLRVHAVATRQLAERVDTLSGAEPSDALLLGALLHDIGKIGLSAAYERYGEVESVPGTPEQRLELERRELGTDHAEMGGILARTLELPAELVAAIERHHRPDAAHCVQVIRVADMLAHHQAGRPVDPRTLGRAATAAGLTRPMLRWILHDLGRPARSDMRGPDDSPLSPRQQQVFRLLGEGKRYGEIAAELNLSRHTVRSHLHAIYEKLGVANRAQAVLRGAERGWL